MEDYLEEILDRKIAWPLFRSFHYNNLGEINTVEDFKELVKGIDLTNQKLILNHTALKTLSVRGIGAVRLRSILMAFPELMVQRKCNKCYQDMDDLKYEYIEKICCDCFKIKSTTS